jgi:hypothetical protein
MSDFVIKEKRSPLEVKNMIRNALKQNKEKAEITIETWEDMYELSKTVRIPKNKQEFYTPEVWSLRYPYTLDELKNHLHIELKGKRINKTTKWIINNLFVLVILDQHYYEKDPQTKRIIRKTSRTKYKKLYEN